MKRVLTALLPIIVIWGVFCFFKDRIYFRLYPAVMCSFAFGAFFISLFKTPLCEVVARKKDGALDAKGVRYCKNLTVIWTVFLALNLTVSIVTIFLPYKVWAFYNGFLSYVFMGALALGELLYRRRVLNG